MKKGIMIFSLIMCSATFTQAQTKSDGSDTIKSTPGFSLDFSQTSDSVQYVLYILKSEDQYEEVWVSRNRDVFKSIDSSDIREIDVFKGESAIAAYGAKAKYGAVVIHFEKGKFKRLKKDLNDRFIDGK